MPRPRKCRKVCHMPKVCNFVPVGQVENQAAVVLTVDEFEAIRLIDEQGFHRKNAVVICRWQGQQRRRFTILPERNCNSTRRRHAPSY